jgi:hypothetical protein
MLATNAGLVRLDLFTTCGEHSGKLGKALARNSTLRHLDLGGSEFRPADMEDIAYGLVRNSTLETLKLDWLCNRMSEPVDAQRNAMIVTLCKSLEVSVSLQNLDLGYGDLDDEDMAHIARAVRRSPSLRYLNVTSEGSYTYKGIQLICEAAMQHTSLVVLYLGQLRHALAASSIAELIMRNTTLQYLSLSDEDDKGNLGSVFDALINTNRALRGISFGGSITCFRKALVPLLLANPQLVCIELWATWTEEDLPAIFQALVDCPRYHKLRLGGLPPGIFDVAPPAVAAPARKDMYTVECIREMHKHKTVAFAMGLHARLGSESLVRQMTLDCVNMVLMSYFSLPAGSFDRPAHAPDGMDLVDFMKDFKFVSF